MICCPRCGSDDFWIVVEFPNRPGQDDLGVLVRDPNYPRIIQILAQDEKENYKHLLAKKFKRYECLSCLFVDGVVMAGEHIQGFSSEDQIVLSSIQ